MGNSRGPRPRTDIIETTIDSDLPDTTAPRAHPIWIDGQLVAASSGRGRFGVGVTRGSYRDGGFYFPPGFALYIGIDQHFHSSTSVGV